MTTGSAPRPVVLQRIEQFVGRTTNWLYDHLRHVPRHEPLVFCDDLANRAEFPLLTARRRQNESLTHRVWRRLMADRPQPLDARWLKRARPIAMNSHFGYVGTQDFGLHAFLDVPWLVSFYGADAYEVSSPAELAVYARMFAKVDRILVLGPEMARRLVVLGCPEHKIVVHALGVDVAAIASRPRHFDGTGPLKVLFAGTFREKKGVEYLVQGAAAARRQGVRLHVTLIGDAAGKRGDAETKAAIFREIDRHGLQEVVTHRPYVRFDELMAMALESHVFAAPSVTSSTGDAEGTPFVLQQMMATGIPVIATIHSDIPLIFGEHRSLLLAERDSAAIGRRLQEYFETPQRLVTDGTAMLERIRTAFDVRTRAAALSDIYDNLGGARSASDVVSAAMPRRVHETLPHERPQLAERSKDGDR